MTNAPSIEDLRNAADILNRADSAGLRNHLDPAIKDSTYFRVSATQLRTIAKELEPKPFEPRVFVVDRNPRDHVTYVEVRHDEFVAIFSGEAYQKDYDKGYSVQDAPAYRLIGHRQVSGPGTPE